MKVKLGDICTLEKGTTGIQKSTPGRYPLVVTGPERKTSDAYQFDCEAVCIPLVSSTGHGHKSLNYIHYQSGKFALGTILVAVIPKDNNILNAEYLREYLFNFKDELLVPLMKGGANVTLSIKNIQNLLLDLPTIEEQKYIIQNIKDVRAKTNDILRNFEMQYLQIEKLKTSILEAAIHGELSTQVASDEAATKLLEHAINEKLKITNKSITNRQISKLVDPPFKLPANWAWARLGDFSIIKGGKRVPRGYQLLQSPTSHIYIRITDMKSGSISDSNLRYINDEIYKIIKNYTISKHDLYITIAGTIGQVGEVPDMFDGMNLTENAAKITPLLINKSYLKYALSSSFCQQQFYLKTNKMAQPKLALIRIQSTLVPLPPLNEQIRIVNKIELLMKNCDNQKKLINSNFENISKLTQSVLLKHLNLN